MPCGLGSQCSSMDEGHVGGPAGGLGLEVLEAGDIQAK